MELGFSEEQTPYDSGSQSARFWTEQWVKHNVYCPNCGHSQLDPFPANSPVADFFCASCREEFELKSQKTDFGQKVLDGAFETKCQRLAANNNPSLFLLNYDRQQLNVKNLFIVPKHFFIQEIIEKRKPLAPTARRAGWIGSHIRLDQIPHAGKIYIVRDRKPIPKELVLAEWHKSTFLRDQTLDARGRLIEVMKCVEAIGKAEFSLDDVYAFETRLGTLYPNNRHVRQKIRQQLQVLRDGGYLEFVSRGQYRLRMLSKSSSS